MRTSSWRLLAEVDDATSPSVVPGWGIVPRPALQSRLPVRSFCLRGSGEDLPLRRRGPRKRPAVSPVRVVPAADQTTSATAGAADAGTVAYDSVPGMMGIVTGSYLKGRIRREDIL